MDSDRVDTKPRTQAIIDLNYWNTSDEKVIEAYGEFAPTYDKVS